MTKFKAQVKILTPEELGVKARELTALVARARIERKPTYKLRKQLAIVKTYENTKR